MLKCIKIILRGVRMNLEETLIPSHIAIIMDGNGRWAQERGLSRVNGHKEGVKTLKKILISAKKIGVKYLTVYAFSTENWKRPRAEVEALMFLFKEYLKNEINELDKNGAGLRFSGRRENISGSLLKLMDEGVEKLKKNNDIILNIAFNYGGKAEIVDAVNKIIEKNQNNKITEEDINENLYNPDIPYPELVIRTSGEFRISNFLIWQTAYSEFYITDKFWPEFDEEELIKAIKSYGKRERRFGGLSNA